MQSTVSKIVVYSNYSKRQRDLNVSLRERPSLNLEKSGLPSQKIIFLMMTREEVAEVITYAQL